MKINRRIQTVRTRLGYAAALLVIFSWASILPPQAWAQLPPLVGRLVVTITSPTSASTVSGTIPVSASVTIVGNLVVAGVQFKLDGADFGEEDTTSPYSISWNTTTTSNGSHTLSVVARGTLGLQFTSEPVTVTVFNDKAPPAVAITSPAAGSTVSGTTTVTAAASDNVGVARVEFFVDGVRVGTDTTAPYSVGWDTTAVPDGSHSLTVVAHDAAGNAAGSAPVTVTVSNGPPPPPGTGFQAGDIFINLEVGLEVGDVQWRAADGTLKETLASVYGPAFWMAFDSAGTLYVPHWITDSHPGNTVERFDSSGRLLGTFGETCAASPLTPYAPSCYDLDPSSIDFDAAGNAYVGQAHGTQDILKFDAAGNLVARFDVAVETPGLGSDFITLAPDGCTIFYTSRGANVLRYDVCSGRQLPVFNASPLPGFSAFTLRILSEGGLLVANSSVIARLDATGTLLQTYDAPGEDMWSGLDLVGDGTFWASSFDTGNVYRFDLATGTVLASFNAAPASTVIGLTIMPR